MYRRNSLLIALLAIGAVLRLLAIEMRPANAPLIAPDEPDYITIAQSLWLGDGFSREGEPTGFRDMLFPVTAAGIMKLTGGSLTAVQIFQVLLGCLTGWLLYVIARRRMTEGWALVVCAAWMLYPMAILYPSMFVTETLYVFLLMLCVLAYDRLEEKLDWPSAVLLGVLLGLLALTRAVGLVMVGAFAIYLAFIRWETPRAVRARMTAIMVTAAVLTILPWMIRNEIVMDRFALNTNGGFNLYIGNNPEAKGAYYFDSPMWQHVDSLGATEAERDRVCRTLASEWFWSDVGRSVNLWTRKFAYFWSTDMAMLTHYAPLKGSPGLAEELGLHPLWAMLLMAIPYLAIVMLGTAGYFLVRNFRTRGLFILQIFMSVVATFISFGLPRFHYPVMPAMLIGAAVYLQHRYWSEVPQWRRLYLLMVVSMFIGIWLYEAMTIAGVAP